MIFDLSNEFQLRQFVAKCQYYKDKGRIVELKARSENKTYPQLKYMHVLIRYVACEVGYDEDYVERNYFKIEANKGIFVKEVEDAYTGRVSLSLRSCATLTKDEMSTAIESFRNWVSINIGIYLPEPNEHRLIMEAEREIERNKMFL